MRSEKHPDAQPGDTANRNPVCKAQLNEVSTVIAREGFCLQSMSEVGPRTVSRHRRATGAATAVTDIAIAQPGDVVHDSAPIVTLRVCFLRMSLPCRCRDLLQASRSL